MVSPKPLASGLALLALATWASTAEARSFRVNDIPNGDKFSCLTCHGDLQASTFTDFGSIARANLAPGPVQEAHVQWEGFCNSDSDRDGKTNGEELGDPDCTWRIGDANPASSVTNPGVGSDATAVCGNGVLDGGEQCEGTQFAVTNCLDLEAGIGDLACTNFCTYDYADCSKPPGYEPPSDEDEEGGCTVQSMGDDASSGVFAVGILIAIAALRRRK